MNYSVEMKAELSTFFRERNISLLSDIPESQRPQVITDLVNLFRQHSPNHPNLNVWDHPNHVYHWTSSGYVTLTNLCLRYGTNPPQRSNQRRDRLRERLDDETQRILRLLDPEDDIHPCSQESVDLIHSGLVCTHLVYELLVFAIHVINIYILLSNLLLILLYNI